VCLSVDVGGHCARLTYVSGQYARVCGCVSVWVSCGKVHLQSTFSIQQQDVESKAVPKGRLHYHDERMSRCVKNKDIQDGGAV